MKLLLAAGLLTFTNLCVGGCATISEDECAIGNWSDRGYRDGTNGARRDKIVDYADDCAKHGFTIDRQSYLSGFENGLKYYCTGDKGYSLGERGASYNQSCSAEQYPDFREGYEQGRAEYRIISGHQAIIDDLEETMAELTEIRDFLRDPELSAEEEKRLLRERDRLEDLRIDLRYKLRDYEREYDLPPADI